MFFNRYDDFIDSNCIPKGGGFGSAIDSRVCKKIMDIGDGVVFGDPDPEIIVHTKLECLIHPAYFLEYVFSDKRGRLANDTTVV